MEIEVANQRKIYTYDEAIKASTEYFKGDTLAATVFINKYALKDSEGNIYESTPDEMHQRIASEIARVESKYANPMSEEELFDLIKNFTYIIPQGSPMTGIGNPFQIASLSNCFVIGNNGDSDSYGGIMKIDQEQVQLMKRRGGVGHDLSHIRPKGSPVKNSALTSTGLEKIFNISEKEYQPMIWFEEEIFANSLDDFFAKRPVDYTKHDKSITANDLF